MRIALICSWLLVASGLHCATQQPVSVTTPSITERAAAGDAQAQFDLGRAYEDGKGVPQDDARAVEWFRKSAEQGNAQAENSLGVMYALGRGVQRNKEEAFVWYKKAAKQGLPDGIYNVAISYYNNEGVGGDIAMAYAWMMAAQNRGDAEAAEALKHIGEQLNNRFDRSKLVLANMYDDGDAIPQDLSAALALYLELANSDAKQSQFISPARYKLCQFYANGRGVPLDYGIAKSWCTKSGFSEAYVAVGRMAEKGLGQQRDLKEAKECYRKAALNGLRDGFMETARLDMEDSSHAEQKNAYFWYYLALKFKAPGADAKVQEAAGRLQEKEIAEIRQQVDSWQTLNMTQRFNLMKKH